MIVSHLLSILQKNIQFYIFMFEAWNVSKGRKVQGGQQIVTVCFGENWEYFSYDFLDIIQLLVAVICISKFFIVFSSKGSRGLLGSSHSTSLPTDWFAVVYDWPLTRSWLPGDILIYWF